MFTYRFVQVPVITALNPIEHGLHFHHISGIIMSIHQMDCVGTFL